MKTDKTLCFFLGANAPKGYYSRFDQLFHEKEGGRCFLLKGGPGTGKSTMLKTVADALKEKGVSIEKIYCPADTDSLDAVMTEDGMFSALDATLPHAVEPRYPGAYETVVTLSDCWDEEKLRHRSEEIRALFDRNRELHEKARHYLSAAAGLFEEASRLSQETIQPEKVVKSALRLCNREIGHKRGGKGSEKIRFLSAVTDKGVFFWEETAKLLADRIFVVEDEGGAVSRLFMNTVRRYALENGFSIVTGRCALFPAERNEHIFIPELRLGFMTSNKRHPVSEAPYRVIHARRFVDEKKAGKGKIRFRFTIRTGTELLREAATCMKEAKNVHDELERIYREAMDFSAVDEKAKELRKAVEKQFSA